MLQHKSIVMKNPALALDWYPASNSITASAVSLHSLVERLTAGLLPLVAAKKSTIINDIDSTAELMTDENVLAFVLGSLLRDAVNGGANGCIRVEAVFDAGRVQIHVHNSAFCLYGSGQNGLAQVVHAVRQLGGDICIYQREQGTTLTFSIAQHKKNWEIA